MLVCFRAMWVVELRTYRYNNEKYMTFVDRDYVLLRSTSFILRASFLSHAGTVTSPHRAGELVSFRLVAVGYEL